MWSIVCNLFQGYMGKGLILGWFLICMVVLWKREKEPFKRILFLYLPIFILILFFNPLWAGLIWDFIGEEIYYRLLWLLPVTITIAYCMVELIGESKGKMRVFLGGAACVGVLFSGSFIYANVHFHPAENIYHMPETVVEICDSIVVEGREVMAVFPIDMVQYVRQYTPLVCMPYGRETLVADWNRGSEDRINDYMRLKEIPLSEFIPLCKEKECHYIVLPEDIVVNGDFADYDYVLQDTIRGYRIYRDTTMYLGY